MEFQKFIILPLLLGLCNCQNKADICGTLYSEGNQEGRQFHISDLDQSIDLSEDFRASDSGWNTTESLVVQPNCILNACPETYFDGECLELREGVYSDVNSLNISSIQSASCSCSKACKCSDIYMKRSSCARAYLKGGCKTCHSLYMDLNKGEHEFFISEFGDAEAFRIRKGCSLTIYKEEEFQGESKTFNDEVVEDVTETISSYECSCDDEQWVPRVPPPRPDSYPPIVGVPEKLDDIVELLNTEQFANHIGLKAALESSMHRRSSKNAYILLIGFTGAGKSTTINFLFDNPGITKTGSYTSTTVDITEFRVPILVDELGLNNTELRVIDTPGLGDTRGLEHDAKFLATLDAYLANHEELNDRIPNVVLIFDKFNNNRFSGEGSAYVKMLRGLETFRDRITDENYSNVIFVFSHFCSETPVTRRKPEKKLAAFKTVIDNYSLFPKPILMAVAENKPDEYNLPMVNGYSKLPNNEYYPRNLYEKLELVTKKGRDPLGQSIFASAFRDSENFNVSSKDYILFEKDGSSKVEYYLRLLSEAVLGVEKTEISIRLQETWDTKISNALKKQFPYSIQYLQKALNLRYIHTKEDIPRTTPAILQLLTVIKHDEATRTLLETGLGIKPPAFKQNTVAGHGYDVFKDLHLAASPFNLNAVELSDIGFLTPKMLTCTIEPSEKETFQILNTFDDYIASRVESLGISGTIPNSSFTGTVKSGYNIEAISMKNDSCILSASREFRTFQFVLNDRPEITDQFKSAVKALTAFNESDHENVQNWRNFFNEFGTHVVKSAYGGGAIQIELSSNRTFSPEMVAAMFDVIKFAEASYYLGSGNNSAQSNRTLLKDGITHTLKFIGGDTAFHTEDLTRMPIHEASKLLAKWKQSLKYNPAILTTEMQLVPLSQYAKKIGQNYSAQIESATSKLFASELKYVEPPRHQGPGASRQDTQMLAQLMQRQEESNARLTEMMMNMTRMNAAFEQKRIELEEKRQKYEQDQREADKLYQRERENATRIAEQERRDYEERMEERRQNATRLRDEMHRNSMAQLDQERKDSERRNRELLERLSNRPSPTQNCKSVLWGLWKSC